VPVPILPVLQPFKLFPFGYAGHIRQMALKKAGLSSFPTVPAYQAS
jgi:hypothetical protein